MGSFQRGAEGGEHDLQASDVNNGDRSFSSAIPNNVWPFTPLNSEFAQRRRDSRQTKYQTPAQG